MQTELTIHGQPPTKKNSQQIIMAGKRPCIIQSKAYRQYEKDVRAQMYSWPYYKQHSGPLHICCEYWLVNARRPDLTNLLAATHDVLENLGIIANDRDIVCIDGSKIAGIDRKNPRVEITIKEMSHE